MKIRLLSIFVFMLVSPGALTATTIPPWVADMPIPTQEKIFLVVKGTYSTHEQAQKVQNFIKQLMGTTPPDGVDETRKYQGLEAKPYLVGMLFDSEERAKWWIDFSYRNRTLPKGKIKTVVITGVSRLPYMPDAVRNGQKRLLTGEEAVARVRKLSDIARLAEHKKLIYKITDFPRNGDLRYEVEVLEAKGKGRYPLMVDFIMVSALNGDITERLSLNLRKDILKEHLE